MTDVVRFEVRGRPPRTRLEPSGVALGLVVAAIAVATAVRVLGR